MKKLLSLLMLSLLIGGTVTASSINGTYQDKPVVVVKVDGKVITPEAPAYIDGGSTMLPLRAVSEALGATITWDQTSYTASVKMPQKSPMSANLTLAQLNKIGESVGIVYALDANGQAYGNGSGFLLDSGIFITNFHVAGKASSVRIELNGQTYTANQPVFKDEKEDLYAVRLNASGGLGYTTTLPIVGEQVYTIGFPHKRFTLNEGKVLYQGVDLGVDSIFSSVRAESGQSGGVLVNGKGEVVGITTSSNDDFTLNAAIQMKYVKGQLDKLK